MMRGGAESALAPVVLVRPQEPAPAQVLKRTWHLDIYQA